MYMLIPNSPKVGPFRSDTPAAALVSTIVQKQ